MRMSHAMVMTAWLTGFARACYAGLITAKEHAMKALIFLLFAAPALALEPIAQEQYINDRLVQARIADRIRRECPSISARIIYAYSQARALERYARNKGYSKAQIDAFLDDRSEKTRIYNIAEAYLKKHGARSGDANSFCRVGHDEIARGSVAGSLLYAR